MIRRAMVVVLALALVLPVLSAAQDDGPLPLVWLRYYTVQPGLEQQFMEAMMEQSGPVFDRMVADGALLNWGLATPLNLTDEKWTHMLWLAHPGWAQVDELIARVGAMQEELSEEEAMTFESTLEPRSRRDSLIRHMALPGTGEPVAPMGYLRAGFYKALPGRERVLVGLYEEIAEPVFERLMEEKIVSVAGISQQALVTDPTWSHVIWEFTPDLASLAAVDREIDAAIRAGGEDLMERYLAAVDAGAYRARLMRVLHAGGPPPE